MNKPEELIEFVEDRPGHDFRYSMKSEKMKKLGWKNNTNFEKGLQMTIDWYRKNKSWSDSIQQNILAKTPWKN